MQFAVYKVTVQEYFLSGRERPHLFPTFLFNEIYSTVTDLARFLGLSTSVPLIPVCPSLCEHSLSGLPKQRIYALALGHEDLNDHQELRHDLTMQTATDRHPGLLSPPVPVTRDRTSVRTDSTLELCRR